MALARTSSTMLNRSGESGLPCLIPVLRRYAFNFSSFCIMLAVGLSYMAFITLSYTDFAEGFNHTGILDFVKSFFCIY